MKMRFLTRAAALLGVFLLAGCMAADRDVGEVLQPETRLVPGTYRKAGSKQFFKVARAEEAGTYTTLNISADVQAVKPAPFRIYRLENGARVAMLIVKDGPQKRPVYGYVYIKLLAANEGFEVSKPKIVGKDLPAHLARMVKPTQSPDGVEFLPGTPASDLVTFFSYVYDNKGRFSWVSERYIAE